MAHILAPSSPPHGCWTSPSASVMAPFRFIIAFYHVATLQSVARAAEELGVTPGAVSQQLRVLEEQLGTKLVTKAGRRIRLTESGERYFEMIASDIENIIAATGKFRASGRRCCLPSARRRPSRPSGCCRGWGDFSTPIRRSTFVSTDQTNRPTSAGILSTSKSAMGSGGGPVSTSSLWRKNRSCRSAPPCRGRALDRRGCIAGHAAHSFGQGAGSVERLV